MYSRVKSLLTRRTLLLTGTIATPIFLTGTAIADSGAAHYPEYEWEWERSWSGHDHAALRRGWQVYKEVCSSCHGLRFLCYRHLVGICLTEAQAKKEAKAAMVQDGPDEDGEMFLRPGQLIDNIPGPYKNDMAARAANNGALPPELGEICTARTGGPNYVFALLTGYTDEVPPGASLGKGQYYNPYFEGGVIGMPPPLNDGAVEYPDGTPATASQMAKDVCSFLNWSAREGRHLETRKRWAQSIMIGTAIYAVAMLNVKRFMFNNWKTITQEFKVGPHP